MNKRFMELLKYAKFLEQNVSSKNDFENFIDINIVIY